MNSTHRLQEKFARWAKGNYCRCRKRKKSSMTMQKLSALRSGFYDIVLPRVCLVTPQFDADAFFRSMVERAGQFCIMHMRPRTRSGIIR